MSARVTFGDSSASPSATTRTACVSSSAGESLSRNPLAPARSAENTYSSASNVVRMITRGGTPGMARIARVASRPLTFGIRMSMSTTSGCVRRTTSTTPRPSSAVPTTVIPSCASSNAANPARIIDWSSTTRTRITRASRWSRGGGACPPTYISGVTRSRGGAHSLLRMDRSRHVLRSLTRLDLGATSIARREVVWLWTLVAVAAVALVAVGWPVTASGYGAHPAAAMAATLVHCAAALLAMRWPWAGLPASVLGALVLMVVTAHAPDGWPWPWPVTVLLTHCLTVLVLALRHPWYWAAALWFTGSMMTVLAPAAITHTTIDRAAGTAAVANGVVLVSL